MPAAVGVDIGCGMVAVRTQFTVADMRKRSDLASLRMAIENAIPLSAGKYDEAVCEAPETAARIAELEESDGAEAAGHVAPNWRLQKGSLGKTAVAQYKKWWISLPDPDMAYLVEDTDEFGAYIRDLRWAQHFALLNQQEMMDRVQACLGEWIGQPVQRAEAIACHHNYTEREKHLASRSGCPAKAPSTPRRGHWA